MRALANWILKEKLRFVEKACEKPNIHIGFSRELLLEKLFHLPFKYRRKITITEQSGNDLTYYQVLIELNSTNFDFSHAQTNGEDIRFTDANGNLLDYWIEEWDAVNETAKIWVEVPSIPANSEIEIFMYYGNPTVASASDGTATFEFFDDFEDLEGWVNDAGYSVSNSELVQNANAGTENKKFYYSGYEPSSIRNLAIRLKWRSTSGGYVTAGWFHTNNNWNGIWWYDGDSNGDAHIRERWDSHSFQEMTYGTTDDNIPQNVNNPYIFEFRADESNFYLVVDDVEYASSDIDFDDMPMHVGYSSWNSGYPAYSDWILVRKYASPEPSVSLGAEETA